MKSDADLLAKIYKTLQLQRDEKIELLMVNNTMLLDTNEILRLRVRNLEWQLGELQKALERMKSEVQPELFNDLMILAR